MISCPLYFINHPRGLPALFAFSLASLNSGRSLSSLSTVFLKVSGFISFSSLRIVFLCFSDPSQLQYHSYILSAVVLSFTGSKAATVSAFRAHRFHEVFRDKIVNYNDPQGEEAGISQNASTVRLEWKIDLSQEDWFPYTDNFGTSEEKAFVAYFKQYVPSLRQKYSKVYLVRNEREFHLYSFDSGERFEPDYVLFLQKPNNEGFEQLQIFIEPKGDHLLENDRWKEDFLLQMREQAIPVKKYVDDNQYRIWGFHFFNQNFRSMPFGEEMASLLE